MKIIIVGLGSMGKRRARLIKGVDKSAEIFGVDTTESRRAEAESLGIKTFANISEAASAVKVDAAFVCTAPVSHAKIIDELLCNNLSVFTELNLISDGYDELIKKAKDKNLTLFLSSTMLYRGEIKFMKNEINAFAKPVNYIYHIGQYLPDWHPWENYKNFFVGDKRTGGCREILGIELPWLLDVFGQAQVVSVAKRNVTTLEIGYPDSYFITLCHQNGTLGMLAVDVASPKAVRSFECYGEGLHLFWEGNPKALYKFDNVSKDKVFVDTYQSFEHDSRYSDNIVENAYVDEITNFFAVLKGTEKPRHTFEKDKIAIDLIEQIEK
ncbi:MAG: Gfo/Idh/MocA family oxidoreductase [Oscillospiraceae bacterium]